MNDYYDVSIKEWRLEEIYRCLDDSTWTFITGSIADKTLIDDIFATHKPTVVVNLAAQAGVRYSIINPDVYIESISSFDCCFPIMLSRYVIIRSRKLSTISNICGSPFCSFGAIANSINISGFAFLSSIF